MSDNGWIKLYRELLNKPIWNNSTAEQKVILVTLILMANHEENEWEWKGTKFKASAGEFVTSAASIIKNSGKGISRQNVRTALERFRKLDFLTYESTKTGLFVHIVNWSTYQCKESKSNLETNQEVTNNQPTANQEVTTNKNDKNERMKERKKDRKDIVELLPEASTNQKYSIDSFEMLCVETIIHSCLELYPNSKVPSTPKEKDKWAIEIDRMKRIDNRSEDDIRQALQFAVNDSFWKGNIRSTKKFRDKFETLLIQSKNTKKGATRKKQSFDEFAEVAKRFLQNE